MWGKLECHYGVWSLGSGPLCLGFIDWPVRSRDWIVSSPVLGSQSRPWMAFNMGADAGDWMKVPMSVQQALFWSSDHPNPTNTFSLSSLYSASQLPWTYWAVIFIYGTDVLRGTMKSSCFLPSVKWMLFSFLYFLKMLLPSMKLSIMAGKDHYVQTNSPHMIFTVYKL